MRMDDGFSTLITFASNGAVKLWEKTVTPGGRSAGGAIDTTTMRRTKWRGKRPKKLRTFGDTSVTCAYDPLVQAEMDAMLGVNQQITITFPDGKTTMFWGWLDNWEPGENSEGEQPTCDVTIIASMEDNAGVEQDPVYG